MQSTGYSCQIVMILEFSRHILEKLLKYKFSRKSVLVEAEFHADKRTDVTKLIAAFRNYGNAPKNSQVYGK
jgi:hypothetical protein